nr:PmoA family protein [Pirellulaceae bacterium]
MMPAMQVRLRFALPALLLCSSWLVTSQAPAAQGFELRDVPGVSLEVKLDGKPVARYEYAYAADRFQDTYKPFLHVLDADGKEPITKGPGGFYTHHRGIFIG